MNDFNNKIFNIEIIYIRIYLYILQKIFILTVIF